VFTTSIPSFENEEPEGEEPYTKSDLIRLPADPFVKWLRALVKRHDSVKEVSERIGGYREKSIADFLSGHRKTVKLTIADQCMTAYDGDVTVHDLWDLDAEIDQSQKAREAKGGNSSS
jgi:hypothetical protein